MESAPPQIATGAISNLVFNAIGAVVDFTDDFWKTSHTWLVFSNAQDPVLDSAVTYDTIRASADSHGRAFSGGTFSWNNDGNNVQLQYAANASPIVNTLEPSTFITLFAMALAGLGYWAFQKLYRGSVKSPAVS